jgi:hypothetical protein
MSASNPLRAESAATPDMYDELDQCSCGVALEGRLGSAYNEEAFRYFLEIERKRSQPSNRSLLLLLVDLKTKAGMSGHIDHAVSTKVFAGLSLCLRETDFIGWYREGQAIGAVLTQRAETPSTDASVDLTQRVSDVLRKGLPAGIVGNLQVRVYQLPSSVSP